MKFKCCGRTRLLIICEHNQPLNCADCNSPTPPASGKDDNDIGGENGAR